MLMGGVWIWGDDQQSEFEAMLSLRCLWAIWPRRDEVWPGCCAAAGLSLCGGKTMWNSSEYKE